MAGVVPKMCYYGETKVVALGKEKGGRYALEYNLFCGKWDEKKDGYFNSGKHLGQTARREFEEEAGFSFAARCDVNTMCKPAYWHNGTPFWVGTLRNGTSRKHFYPTQEISSVQYFPVSEFLQTVDKRHIMLKDVDGNLHNVSVFAYEVIQAMKKRNLL